MLKGKVLVIGSNADRIEVRGGGWAPTGNYLNETVVPVMTLIAAGYEPVLATPDGTKMPMDAVSDSPTHFGNDQNAYARGKSFWEDDPVMNRIERLSAVLEAGLDGYAGVFVPGGQAPVVDLMQDKDVGEILRHFHEHGKPTALLCHGPIALIAALPHAREYRAALIAGDEPKAREWAKGWPYAGYDMTIFSAHEELWVEDKILHAKMYFNMPYALNTAGGAVLNTKVDFQPHVVADRELITGQNPASDHPLAARFIEALDHAAVA